MAGSSYKKWDKAFRSKSGAITRRLKNEGLIEQPKCCERCGQDEGIIHFHNEDYDVTMEIGLEVVNRIPMKFNSDEEKKKYMSVLESLCWTCHMIHHSARRNKIAHDRYFDSIKNGYKPRPVFKHNFKELSKYGF